MIDMGQYDDIVPETLRADLRHFAELILQLDSRDQLLDATPRLLKVLGDLRAKIFAYEVRITGRLFPKEGNDLPGDDEDRPDLEESKRVVEEAIRRIEEAEREWSGEWDPEKPAE
jgi:hypothetical protein